MTLSIFEYIFIFVIGAVIGSFLNVMALRLLSGEDYIFNRSKCPKCGEKIAWHDNIPIISYILLKAKCRSCKAHISWQYPLVELITGLLFVFIFQSFGVSLKTFFLLFLTCNFVVITITDLKEQVIYDINSIPIIPIGLLYSYLNLGGEDMLASALIGALVGAAFFEIFSRLGLLLAGEYAFGGGDTLLGAALGAWFGWKMLIGCLIISFIIQVIVGVPVILHNMYKNKDYHSIWAMIGLMLSMIMAIFNRLYMFSAKPIVAIVCILGIFILAGVSIFVIFSRMRETKSHTFMAFGPPLVASGFIVMFFGDYIAKILPF